MLQTLISGLQDLLFPRNCLLCRQYIDLPSTSIICPSCEEILVMNHPPFCAYCSRPLRKKEWDTGYCLSCTAHPPAFDMAWGAYRYNEPMKRLIHNFKYYGKTHVRHVAGRLIQQFCVTYDIDINQFDLIIPMPLHGTRMRERGFNQSALIAAQIHPNIAENTLFRVKNTTFQSHLAQKDRWTNVREAFRINPHLTVENQSILLIDDLLTTGATASEAAKTLKKAGASTVTILTLAIT